MVNNDDGKTVEKVITPEIALEMQKYQYTMNTLKKLSEEIQMINSDVFETPKDILNYIELKIDETYNQEYSKWINAGVADIK